MTAYAIYINFFAGNEDTTNIRVKKYFILHYTLYPPPSKGGGGPMVDTLM